MNRLIGVVLFSQLAICTLAQTVSQPVPTSDPQALSLAQKSMAALSGGAAISDVTLNANVISILGSDNETGTGTFRAKGTAESRVDLSLPSSTRSDARNSASGVPAGAWTTSSGIVVAYTQHNCWTDASWFFPALSSLSQTGKQNVIFKYIGQEQHRGVNTQHIEIFQNLVSFAPAAQLSTMDFYLDPVSFLPVALAFNVHSDSNVNVNIPIEVLFANYQNVGGTEVAFHFQQLFSGSVVLDATVSSVLLNTGLLDNSFTLQ